MPNLKGMEYRQEYEVGKESMWVREPKTDWSEWAFSLSLGALLALTILKAIIYG